MSDLYRDPRPRLNAIIADGNCTACYCKLDAFGDWYVSKTHTAALCADCFAEFVNVCNWQKKGPD